MGVVFCAPDDQFDEKWREVKALGSEVVGNATCISRGDLSRDYPGLLKALQAVGEDVRGDSLLAFAEASVVALSFEEEVADDEECPAVAEDVERKADRTVGSPRVGHER